VGLFHDARFGASYGWIRGFEALGFGDVSSRRLALWIGMAGWQILLLVAVLSALMSLVIVQVEEELDAQQAIAFGPHLAVALWLSWAASPLQIGV